MTSCLRVSIKQLGEERKTQEKEFVLKGNVASELRYRDSPTLNESYLI